MTNKLDRLAEYMSKRELLLLQKQELINSIMTDEIKAKITDVNMEFADQLEAVDDNIEKLTSEIKAEVVASGTSVKGTYLHAVYSKGRVSWDTKKLDGLALVVPQLKEARREGDPSVSIRKI